MLKGSALLVYVRHSQNMYDMAAQPSLHADVVLLAAAPLSSIGQSIIGLIPTLHRVLVVQFSIIY